MVWQELGDGLKIGGKWKVETPDTPPHTKVVFNSNKCMLYGHGVFLVCNILQYNI